MLQAIILTALSTEFKAVLCHLEQTEEDRHEKGTLYEQGRFGPWRVSLVQVGAGNSDAAMETERAIARFGPQVALLVGVAQGRKNVALGDVVVATKVYGYESGRAALDFQSLPELGNSSYTLVQRAQADGRKEEWRRRIPGPRPARAPRVFMAPIAAGEKTAVSARSEVARFLSQRYDDALAVEMEGYGFLKVAQANEGVMALVVRGISAYLSTESPALHAAESKERAARHAAAFAFEVLAGMERQAAPGRSKRSLKAISLGAGGLLGILLAVQAWNPLQDDPREEAEPASTLPSPSPSAPVELYSMRARVLDPEGRPVQGSTLRASVGDKPRPLGDGRWEVQIRADELPGDKKVTLWAEHPDGTEGETQLTLGESPQPEVAVRLGPSAVPALPPILAARHITLEESQPQHLDSLGLSLSVTFSRGPLGTYATLRVVGGSEPPIVEALLGPGGQIPFRSAAGDHVLTVVAWNPAQRSLELSVAPRS